MEVEQFFSTVRLLLIVGKGGVGKTSVAATIANVAGVDLEAAVREKYGNGCPGCGQFLCTCDISAKP